MTNFKDCVPAFRGYFADPFVWRHGEFYYAVGTPEADQCADGRVFPLLRSSDLRDWTYLHNALERPEPSLGGDFWAPEVAYHDGAFYMYYSVGKGDKAHHIRVAKSATAEGPYVDVGALTNLETCPFAIDAHPFRDDDGQWYLFYARDFLDSGPDARPGTALVVDKLRSMTELEGSERVVLRARHDWQLFAAERPMYGAVYNWHTLEGPAVFKRDGQYFCFYSGGRWENETYGVDYGVASHVMGPYTDIGNEKGPRVLKTIPKKLLGPGHNSIVTAKDKEKTYLVYHAWDSNFRARQMFVSELLWTNAGPQCSLSYAES